MTNQKIFANTGQLSAIGFKVAGTVTRLLGEENLSFDEAQHIILSDEEEIEKLTEKFIADIFSIKVDHWTEEKRRIDKFYLKFFRQTIDWSSISLPPKTAEMHRLEVIFSDITEDDAFAAYAKEFGEDAVWKAYNSISKAIKLQQERPAGTYAISHVGRDEPDMLGKSYDDGINDGIKFMIPKEGLIAAFRFRTETGKMYDVKGLTRFAALDDVGDAMRMSRDGNGRFGVGRGDRDLRNAQDGLRQVSF